MVYHMDYNVDIYVDDEVMKLFNCSYNEHRVAFNIVLNPQIRYVIVNGVKMEFNYLGRFRFTIDHCVLHLFIDSDDELDNHTVILPDLYSNITIELNYCNNLVINISKKD